jgi:hypothetical protein
VGGVGGVFCGGCGGGGAWGGGAAVCGGGKAYTFADTPSLPTPSLQLVTAPPSLHSAAAAPNLRPWSLKHLSAA